MIDPNKDPFANIKEHLDDLTKLSQGKDIEPKVSGRVSPPKPQKRGISDLSSIAMDDYMPKFGGGISSADGPILGKITGAVPKGIELNKIQTVFKNLNNDLAAAKTKLQSMKGSRDTAGKKALEGKIAELEKHLMETMSHLDNLFNRDYTPEDKAKLRDILEDSHQEATKNLADAKKAVYGSLKEIPKEKFKPNPKPPVVIPFTQTMNAKNVGHLVGDSFVAEMKDSKGNSLEGNTSSASLKYMGSAIDHLTTTYPDTFKNNKETFSLIRQKLERAESIADEIVAAAGSGKSAVSLANSLQKKLEALKEDGDSLIIPGGWADAGGGHAIVFEFTRVGTELLMRVINTGEGLEFHDARSEDSKYANTIREFKLSDLDIKKQHILERLLEANIVGFNSALSKNSGKVRQVEVYKILDPYSVPLSEASEAAQGIMKAQLGGTCTLRSLMAYASMKIGKKDYKAFKNLWERETVKMFLKDHQTFGKDPALRTIVGKALPNLFRHLEKETNGLEVLPAEKKKLLEELEGYKAQYKALYPVTESKNQEIKTGPKETIDVSSSVAKSIATNQSTVLPNVAPTVKIPEVKKIPSPLSSEPISVDHILAKIAEVDAYCLHYEAYNPKSNMLRQNLLSEIGRIFTDPNNLETKKALLAHLVGQRALTENLFAAINSLSVNFIDNLPKMEPVSLSTQIAQTQALAVGCELAKIMDAAENREGRAKLSSYIIDPLELKVIERAVGFPSILDPEKAQEYIDLKNFFTSINADKTEDALTLFDGSQFEVYRQGASKEESGKLIGFKGGNLPDNQETRADFAYTLATKPNTEEFQRKAMALFEKQSEKCDIQPWLVNFAYATDSLPSQYRLLRNLNMCSAKASNYTNLKDCPLGDPTSNRIGIANENEPYFRCPFADALVSKVILEPKSQEFATREAKEVLQVHDQNKLAADFPANKREMLSLMSVKSELQIPMLIDFFSDDLTKLSKIDNQAIMSSILFQPQTLATIMKSPDSQFIVQRLLEHLDKGIEFYSDHIVGMSKGQANQTLAFLLNTKVRTLQFAKKLTPSENVESIKNYQEALLDARAKIKRAQNNPQFKCAQILSSSYIESFKGVTELSSVEAKSLALAVGTYWKNTQVDGNQLYTKDAIENIETIMVQLYPLMTPHFATDKSLDAEFLKSLCENYELSADKMQGWKTDHFPIIVASNIQGQPLEIDLLTGIAKLEGRQLGFGKIPDNYRQNPVYQEVFGYDFSLAGKQEKGYFEGHDKAGILTRLNFDDAQIIKKPKKKFDFFGVQDFHDAVQADVTGESIDEIRRGRNRPNITWDPKKSHIQKQIGKDGIWYEYKSSDLFDQRLKRLPNSKNLEIWTSADPNRLGTMILNKLTQEIVYRIDENGLFSFPGSNEKYQWRDFQNTPETNSINQFANDAIVWQNVKGTNHILEFPSFIQTNGKTLKFTEKEVKVTGKGGAEVSLGIRYELDSDPDYILSTDQKLVGLEGFNNFLVIKDKNGLKPYEVIVPQKSHLRQHPGKDILTNRAPDEPIGINRFTLNKEGFIESRKNAVEDNAMAAYHQITHASKPEDFLRAMSYLRECGKLGRYSAKELKALGIIFNQGVFDNKKERDPDAFAIRLYIGWLVHDNFSKYPLLEQKGSEANDQDLMASSPPEKWEAYWQNPHVASDLSEVVRGYLQRKNNVQSGLKIQDLVSENELLSWGVISQIAHDGALRNPEIGTVPHRSSPKTKFGFFINSNRMPEFRTRLGENFVKHLDHVIGLASSHKLQERAQVKQLMRDAQYDTNEEVDVLKSIAITFLISSERKMKILDLVNEYKAKIDRLPNDERNKDVMKQNADNFAKDVETFCTGQKYKDTLIPLEEVSHFKDSKKEAAQRNHALLTNIINNPIFDMYVKREVYQQSTIERVAAPAIKNLMPPEPKVELPKTMPPTSPFFEYSKQAKNLFEELREPYDLFFNPQPAMRAGQHRPPPVKPAFVVNSQNNPELAAAVKIVNDEYVEGVRKNNELGTTAKESATITADRLLAKYNPSNDMASGSIGISINRGKTEMSRLKREIVAAANVNNLTKEKKRIQIGGEQRRQLTLDDCLIHLLHKDEKRFKEATGITSDKELQDLIGKLTKFLEVSAQTIQKEKLKDSLLEVNSLKQKGASEEELSGAVNNVGNVLAEKHDLSKVPSAIPILIYEHKMRELNRKIILKPDQIAGLNQMMEGKDTQLASIFLHRIQAGGKTLVWGQLMAELKADGYHLSLHVSPTQLYTNNLSDMGNRSKALFSQKVNTLIFDDNPKYFTYTHLTDMKRTLEKAIANREYVNTTNESLRALRDKYVKMNLELHSGKEINNRVTLENSLNRMREILTLLRERGVFTFDEVHLAMDPRKLLNMPYGDVTPPNLEHTGMIGEMLKHVVNAKDPATGNPLCRIRQNFQSQQTEGQRAAMLESVTKEILDNPAWQSKFKITQNGKFNQDQYNIIKKFIESKEATLPDGFMRGDPNTDLLLLAHCMIAEGWLTDALAKNVHEHHGIVREPGMPPISGPFNANKTPAKGSEFSDAYVKGTYTYIAYLVEGLQDDQAVDLVNKYKEGAIAEYREKKVADPKFDIKKTAKYMEFTNFLKAAGVKEVDLLDSDFGKPQVLDELQKALKKETPESLNVLFTYVNEHILKEIKIFGEEVSANGQNTASMASANNGYSGSMDNPLINPLLRYSDAKSVDCKPEVGVNGQTLDLLVRSNNEVWVVDSKPESVFDQLINKLAGPEKSKVRAIIDVGCQFRGMANYDVAKMVDEKLQNADVKGILFFDNATGDMCFIKRGENNLPIKTLSGTDPETILRETGMSPEQLFTIYSQEKITGTDVAQMKDAIAVVTLSEGTEIPQVIQGDRRMRGLDKGQRLITAIQSGSLERVAGTVKKDELKTLKVGEKVQDPAFIKDLIVFAQVNQVKKQQADTLTLCTQKMENLLQQFLLDKIYENPPKLKETDVFSKAANLFKRKVGIDLFAEYALAKKEMSTDKYLKNYSSRLSALFRSLKHS